MDGSQMPMFAFAASYPDCPASRPVDTSIEAAERIEERAPDIRDRALSIIRSAGVMGATADEVAERLHLTVLSVRPRISELKKMGLICDSEVRRTNRSGRRAAVMVAVR